MAQSLSLAARRLNSRLRFLWFLLAGAGGAAARYGLSTLIGAWVAFRCGLKAGFNPAFPPGAFVINTPGTLLPAFVSTLALRGVASSEARFTIGAGFCGAFTTFSTFSWETEALFARGTWFAACVYVGATLIFGLLAVLAGRAAAGAVSGAL